MFANQTSAQVVGDPQFNTNFTISGFPQVVSAYTIYPFDGTNGAVGITDGLTYFTNGLLYGETGGGGNGMAYGTVFSIFPGAVSGQAPSVIYYFHPLWGQNFGFSDNDGQNPTGPLVFGWDYPVVDCSVEQVQRSDTEGWFTKTNIIYSSTPKPALFGTTVFGGKHGHGTVFRIDDSSFAGNGFMCGGIYRQIYNDITLCDDYIVPRPLGGTPFGLVNVNNTFFGLTRVAAPIVLTLPYCSAQTPYTQMGIIT